MTPPRRLTPAEQVDMSARWATLDGKALVQGMLREGFTPDEVREAIRWLADPANFRTPHAPRLVKGGKAG